MTHFQICLQCCESNARKTHVETVASLYVRSMRWVYGNLVSLRNIPGCLCIGRDCPYTLEHNIVKKDGIERNALLAEDCDFLEERIKSRRAMLENTLLGKSLVLYSELTDSHAHLLRRHICATLQKGEVAIIRNMLVENGLAPSLAIQECPPIDVLEQIAVVISLRRLSQIRAGIRDKQGASAHGTKL